MAKTRDLLVALALVAPGLSAASALVLKPVATAVLPCPSQGQLISPTGDQVAVSCNDHSLKLVDLSSGKTQHSFSADEPVSSYDYSPDGHWFAVGRLNGEVEVIPSSGAGQAKRWKAGSRRIDIVKFSPDSRTMVVVQSDLPGQVWELDDTPAQIASLHSEFSGPVALAFSPDGKLLVTADGDTVIRFYEASKWQLLRENRKQVLETFAVAFTPDGKHVLMGGADNRITEVDAATAEEVRPPASLGDNIRMIIPFGDAGDALLVLADVDGKRPPKPVFWNSVSGKTTPLTSQRPITSGGVLRGKLWLGSAQDKSFELWEYEEPAASRLN